MKALIYKDLLTIWKNCRYYLLMCGVFLAASVFVEEYSFLQMYPVIFMGMLVNTLIAYDERDKWDRQVLTMPITRKQYVTGKYLVGMILQGTVLVLTAGANALQMVLHEGFLWEAFRAEVGILLVLASAAPSLTLPFIFRNGSEKGRMAYLIVIGTVFALAALGAIILEKLNLMHKQVELPGGPLVVVLVVLLYLGSWVLSVRWYEKREF
mgnify:CR=1 FL=1